MAESRKFNMLALAGWLLAAPGPALPEIDGLQTSPVVSPEQISGVRRVDAEGLLDLVAQIDDLTLIDARIESDRKNGYIENSISLPDIRTDCESLARQLPSLDQPVAFYCNGPRCGRSATSAKAAVQCGYHQVYWFRGGIEEWTEKQYPLVR
ncbi:MAG TPA: rhodanese-like domain-containing protein [Gammaproteobacteria bacterium]|nr:rhodanese-like domain-containing protein [Gammaproteobacteria bacterium]